MAANANLEETAPNQLNPNKFRILVCGSAGCGKTVWLDCLRGQPFKEKYVCTAGWFARSYEKEPLQLPTTKGVLTFEVEEISQTSVFRLFPDHRPGDNAPRWYHGAIIMFNVDARHTYREDAHNFCGCIRNKFGDIPVVLCGTRVDLKHHRRVMPRQITLHKSPRNSIVHYYDISAKSAFNIAKPFLRLACELTGDKSLVEMNPLDLLYKMLRTAVAPRLAHRHQLTGQELQCISELSNAPTLFDLMRFYSRLKELGSNMREEILRSVHASGDKATDAELRLVSIISSDSPSCEDLMEMVSLLVGLQFLVPSRSVGPPKINQDLVKELKHLTCMVEEGRITEKEDVVNHLLS